MNKLSHIPRIAATAFFIPLFGVIFAVDEVARGKSITATAKDMAKDMESEFMFLLGDIIEVCVGEK